MPARRYDLVCDDSERGKMRQRLIRQKIRSVGLSPGPSDLDKNSNIYTDITVVKSPRAPMYEVQYVKTRKDGIKQIPVVRSLPKNTAGKGDGDKSSQTTKTDGSEKSEVDETGSTVSQKSDVKPDDMVGLRVIACNRKDGLYYPGTVASHLESTYAMVNFNFNKRQKVRTHMIIPMSGAIPRPELAPGDFVLVKVFKQHVSLDCYVPAIIEFVPEDFRTHSKFYSVLLYNGQRASTMRKFIVKIGRSRFEVAVNYIAHIQQIERQKRVALSEATPRSEDTPTSKTTSEHTDRYEDVMSDHSSVRSSDRSSVKSEDRSSIRSGSERGRKKKEKVTKKLAQKKKEDERTKSRSDDKKQKHSRSSSRSSSRTKSKSRSRSRSEEKKQKHSRSSSKSSSRTKSKSRSRSRSKSRSTSRSRSRSRSMDSESTYSRSSNASSRKERRSGSKDRPISRSRSRAQTRSRGDSRSRTSSHSYSSRSRTRSRSSSKSRSYLSDASWVKSKNQRKSRSSSDSSTVKSKSRSPSNDNDRTPRASPIERPTNPVPKPRPSSQISPRRESSDPRSDIYVERSRSSKSRNSSEIVQFDEKDQVIGELQHQLDKQLRKQMRQERIVQFDEKDQVIGELQHQLDKQLRKQMRQEQRLIRQARKINKIQRKLKQSDHNDSLQSDKTDRSRSAKSSSDTDGSPRRRKESPDGTSYRDSPDIQSMRKGVPGLEFDTEVLARWSDDGWYYRGRILKSDESKLVLMDTMGHLEEIVRDDVITEEGHRSDVVQPQDCVIALHPKYVFSYAPGEVLHVYGNGNINVEFYDGTLSKLAPGEVYKISKEKYKHDVEYIVEKEKELIGKSVVARDDRSGVFRLGVVDSRVGIGQQYYLKWLDGDMCKQTSTHIFEVSLRRINSEHLEHVLAPTDSRCVDYKPAVVLQREPLHLQFCDGYGNPEVRREQCFWINKDYYTNAVDFLLARQGGSQSTSTL